MRRLAALAALFIAGCAQEPAQTAGRFACAAPPGAEALWADPDKRIIIIGEMHGTNEAPAAFGEIVCAGAEQGPVVVALELEARRDETLHTYLASDEAFAKANPPLAHEAFRSVQSIQREVELPDGRTSLAMAALIERLRVLRAAGADVKLALFKPELKIPGETFLADGVPIESLATYERDMAANIEAAAASAPDARVLVLVGNFHASKQAWRGMPYAPMGAHLPAEAVLSLNVAHAGGEAWTCDGADCGVHAFGPTLDDGARRLVALFGATREGFDGLLALGPISASPPPHP